MFSETIQKYFKLIQDPTRRGILETIEDRSCSFSEIRDKLDIPVEQSSKLVYHIQQVEDMGLIEKNEEDRYELTKFGEKLMVVLGSLESTIKSGITSKKWIEDLKEKYPGPPIYITELHGNISITNEKFDAGILVARITDELSDLGIDFQYSRYTEKDESGVTKDGWLILGLPTGVTQPEEVTPSGLVILNDGSFYVAIRYTDDIRLFPYYDYYRHIKFFKEGKCKVPFFFVQAMAYNYLFVLYASAHVLWGKNLKITLSQPKNLYVWVPAETYETTKSEEVNVTSLWTKELEELSWKETEQEGN